MGRKLDLYPEEDEAPDPELRRSRNADDIRYPPQDRSHIYHSATGYPHYVDDYRDYHPPEWYERDREREHYADYESRGLWRSMKNFFGKGPKGYKRSDERILDEVSETLYRHPDIDASEIEVAVEKGHVYLSGWVSSRQMKRMAEAAVEFIMGVEDVHNNLRVGESEEREEDLEAPAPAPKKKSSYPKRRSRAQLS